MNFAKWIWLLCFARYSVKQKYTYKKTSFCSVDKFWQKIKIEIILQKQRCCFFKLFYMYKMLLLSYIIFMYHWVFIALIYIIIWCYKHFIICIKLFGRMNTGTMYENFLRFLSIGCRFRQYLLLLRCLKR